MTVATERSRRDLSIGDVKIDVRIDYPSQKPLQSIGLIEFLEGPGAYPDDDEEEPMESKECCPKPIKKDVSSVLSIKYTLFTAKALVEDLSALSGSSCRFL